MTQTNATEGLTATQILSENGIEMIRIDNIWYLEKDGKRVIRPHLPKLCYLLIMAVYNIDEPRLKDFK